MKYFDEASSLWRTSVPESGQAFTVQGELLRAVEKLRDEAQRNGNGNWDNGFEILLGYLREILLGSDLFNQAISQEIRNDLDRLNEFDDPETSDTIFDRLADHVIEWCHAHPEPVPHVHNPDLLR